MGKVIYISGEINGISQEAARLIKQKLGRIFYFVKWENSKLSLEGEGNISEESLSCLYDKIAPFMKADGEGKFEEDGEGDFEYAFVFFHHKKWKRVAVEVTYPENPFKTPAEHLDTIKGP